MRIRIVNLDHKSIWDSIIISFGNYDVYHMAAYVKECYPLWIWGRFV